MAVLAHKVSTPGLSPMPLLSARDFPNVNTLHASRVAPMESFASPTESEFSEHYDPRPQEENVNRWDEEKVGNWLREIGCGQYEPIFSSNNISGSNLIECDQAVLKEMGIKKIGDRLRIHIAIKQLRNSLIPNIRKRNRESLALLDRAQPYTPNRDSLATLTRSRDSPQSPGYNETAPRPSTKQASISTIDSQEEDPEFAEIDRHAHTQYYGTMKSSSSRGGQKGFDGQNNIPTKPTGHHASQNSISRQTESTKGWLPAGLPLIRVIYNNGQTKTIDIKSCRTAEEIMTAVMRKCGINDGYPQSYCLYLPDKKSNDMYYCRKLKDDEIVSICSDKDSELRSRLILRKVGSGLPTIDEVETAHNIGSDSPAPTSINKGTGEALNALKGVGNTARLAPVSNLSRNQSRDRQSRAPKPIKQFQGGRRPPSELINAELTTYFPDHNAAEIQRTVSLSQRRSARLSRIQNRLSIASNLSYKTIMEDAPPLPPMPSIADQWLEQGNTTISRPQPQPRPLSLKLGPNWRDSIISNSVLSPLQEESPMSAGPSAASRKSFMSFASGSDGTAIQDDSRSVFEDLNSSGSNSNITQQVREALAHDGEEHDEELEQFLNGNHWDNVQWMKGALIGQGSFGSVYLGLHPVSGEVVAVKQVDMPSKTGETDKLKEQRVAALRHEINLLKDLHHPHIVQYLGSNCTAEEFNIFLEYVPGGSVASMLQNYGYLQEPLISNFVRQILDGLIYLHARDIIHRDIKGANILVDTKGTVKISDFGISKRVDVSAIASSDTSSSTAKPSSAAHRASLQGSIYWMAPEVVRQKAHTTSADIWSLGCLIVEMFTGEHPFPTYNQVQAIFQIGGAAKPATPDKASANARSFLEKTFEPDYTKRASAKTLSEHVFLVSEKTGAAKEE